MLMGNKIPATDDLYVYKKKQQWSTAPIIVRSKLTFRRMKKSATTVPRFVSTGKQKTSCVNNMLSTFVRFSSSGHTRKASFRPLGSQINSEFHHKNQNTKLSSTKKFIVRKFFIQVTVHVSTLSLHYQSTLSIQALFLKRIQATLDLPKPTGTFNMKIVFPIRLY